MLELHRTAKNDIRKIFTRYAILNPNLADRFMNHLRTALSFIEQFPEASTIYLYGTRCYILSKFSYLVIYRIDTDRIDVIAVVHSSRKPGFWRSRLYK